MAIGLNTNHLEAAIATDELLLRGTAWAIDRVLEPRPAPPKLGPDPLPLPCSECQGEGVHVETVGVMHGMRTLPEDREYRCDECGGSGDAKCYACGAPAVIVGAEGYGECEECWSEGVA